MTDIKIRLFIILAALFSSPAAAQDYDFSRLKFVGVTYCPLFCAPGESSGPGLAHETITNAIKRATGITPTIHTKNRDDHRARASVALGNADLAMGLSTLFSKNPRINHTEIALFTLNAGVLKRADDNYTFMGFDANNLDDKMLVWKKKGTPPQEMEALINKKHANGMLLEVPADDDSYLNAIKLIASGEADIMLEAYEILVASWKASRDKTDTVVVQLNVGLPFYIGHNVYTERGKELGRILNEEMIKMEADGTLDQLRDKYFN